MENDIAQDSKRNITFTNDLQKVAMCKQAFEDSTLGITNIHSRSVRIFSFVNELSMQWFGKLQQFHLCRHV